MPSKSGTIEERVERISPLNPDQNFSRHTLQDFLYATKMFRKWVNSIRSNRKIISTQRVMEKFNELFPSTRKVSK